MKLEEFKEKVKIKASIDEKRYIISKLSEIPKEVVFALIRDKNEITAIHSEEQKLNNVIKEEKFFKIITFEITLPFELVGFMAYISKIIAEKNVSIFAISAFSTDHILVKEEDLNNVLEAFKENNIEIVK